MYQGCQGHHGFDSLVVAVSFCLRCIYTGLDTRLFCFFVASLFPRRLKDAAFINTIRISFCCLFFSKLLHECSVKRKRKGEKKASTMHEQSTWARRIVYPVVVAPFCLGRGYIYRWKRERRGATCSLLGLY